MNLIIENKEILQQVKALIEQLNDEQYTKPNPIFSGSSLGQHFRHLIEFYIEIEKGLKQKEICYDQRKRDLNIESNRNYALDTICNIEQFLSQITNDISLVFIANYTTDSDCEEKIQSSLYRELAYGLEHTIHHLAIIKIGLTSIGVEVDENLGVAPSTVRNRTACAQ